MNKPLAITIKEVETELAQVCNKSGLPIPILNLIIKGLYSEIHSLAVNQAMEEEKIYMESIRNNDIRNKNDTLGGADETE